MTTQTKNTGVLTPQPKSASLTWDEATFTWDSATSQTWDDPTVRVQQTRNTGVLTPQTKSV